MKTIRRAASFMLAVIVTVTKVNAQNANTTLSNLISPTKINADLLPDNTNTRSLGSSAKSWKNIFMKGAYFLNGNKFISNTGTSNTFIGTSTGNSNTTGSSIVAIGYNALFLNTTGYENTANGAFAMLNNSTGSFNAAVGSSALYSNTSGTYNTAMGSGALYNNTTGNYNTAEGRGALYNNTIGFENTAAGMFAAFDNISGSSNVSSGTYSMFANTTGNYNTAVGNYTLNATTASQYNTAIGYSAGGTYDYGWNNVFVGANSSANGAGYYNDVAVGESTICTASNQARIGNSFTTSIGGFANWTNISDGRVKKNIKENVPGLAFINKLKPVTYNLDLDAVDKIVQRPAVKDKDGKIFTRKASQEETTARNAKQQIVYSGFVAQDVEKAAKELNYDFSGVDAAKSDKDLYGLRYSEFVVPLVKAVQELSRQNNDLKTENDDQQKQINELEQAVTQLRQGLQNCSPCASAAIQSNSASAGILENENILEQNIPNPFTSSTIINYTLSQKFSHAQIVITDKTGKTIKQITLSGMGRGSLTVDASTLSSGAYQYSLYVDSKLFKTKQMVLVK